MPRRTNEFQQLVLLLQHQLADQAAVKESEEFRDTRTGSLVEVDVTILREVNDVATRIGVECSTSPVE